MGREAESHSFDDDPVLQALLAAHTNEQALEVEHQQTPAEERQYMLNGELVDADTFRGECPYLRSLGDTAFRSAIASYEYRPNAPAPMIELPQEHPVLKPAIAPKSVENVVVELEPQLELQIHESSQIVEHTKIAEQVSTVLPVEVVEELARVEAVPAVNPTVPVEQITEIIAAPLQVSESEPLIIIESGETDAPQKPLISEEMIAILPFAEAEPKTEETSIEVAITEIALPELVQPVLIEQLTEQIDRELLAEVAPELAQTFEAVLAHIEESVAEDVVVSEFVTGEQTSAEPEAERLLPEALHDAVIEFIETAPAEEAVIVEAQVVILEVAANRLAVLAQEGRLDEPEARAITAMIRELYEELKTRGLVPKAIPVAVFISQLIEIRRPEDIRVGTHEKKRYDLASLSGILDASFNAQVQRLPLGWLRLLVA